jgi:hypothetical protein
VELLKRGVVEFGRALFVGVDPRAGFDALGEGGEPGGLHQVQRDELLGTLDVDGAPEAARFARVKRIAQLAASRLLRTPSIQPKQSASSNAYAYVMPPLPEDTLWKPMSSSVEVVPRSWSQAWKAACEARKVASRMRTMPRFCSGTRRSGVA